MATQIAQRELRNNNADILNRVQAGESFVVTRNGVPVADVTPHAGFGAPPMFPTAKDLVARRRASGMGALGLLKAWMDDIDNGPVSDDPFDARA